MKKICLFLVFLSATIPTVFSQTDLSEINKPLEYVEQANKDIENGDYEQAVQKLIAAIRLQPKLRDAYLSLNVACSYTNQNAILKSYLQKAKQFLKKMMNFAITWVISTSTKTISLWLLKNIPWPFNMPKRTEKIMSWFMPIIKTVPAVI